MPFYKQTVGPGRLWLRSAAPVRELGDVCSLAAVSLLRQLADVCGHSLAMLDELEEHLLALRSRTRNLERRVSRLCALLSGRSGRQKPRPTEQASSNLDPESKKTAHSKLSWQQPVNVFLTSGRPPCMEELHQEAQLNLQSLLQADCFSEEYEERYVDSKATGETFRYCSHSPAQGFSPEIVPKQSAKRLEFVYLPTTRRVSEDETTTVGVRSQESCLSLPTTPEKLKNWGKVFPLPIPEESRWHQSSSIQANIVPINVSGELFDKHASSHHSLFNTETAVNPKSTLRRRRTITGLPNLSLQDQGNNNGLTSASLGEAPSSCFISEVAHGRNSVGHRTTCHPFPPPLRKTYSDLGQSVQAHFRQSPTKMDSTGMIYASPSCNGDKDSTFSPSWQENDFSYMTPSSPVFDSKSKADDNRQCSSQCKSRVPLNVTSPVDYEDGVSFSVAKDDQLKDNRADFSPATENPGPDQVNYFPSHLEDQEPPILQAGTDACIFRERSLSMPTDSGSLCSVDIIYTENQRGSGNYALNYPSGSSDGSTSTENISIGNEQESRQRQRTRSISLKKAKKKPSPPMRSVSLIKDENVQKMESSTSLPKDNRPKSLCIPLDYQRENHMPACTQGNTIPVPKDTENMHFSHHWYLTEWKSSDPYRSLSGSSTATGTTVIECMKTRESSESLDSPSVSRATTPSQISTETDSKISSPGRPLGLMSPSSGYSSQSETPTPTIPVSLILGHPSHQTKMRPLVPERKSSLPATSPIERSPKSRLLFELPVTPPTHLDLSGLKKSKGKAKASRHHSDSNFGFKLGQKTSPIQPLMPMVTQSDLRSVRLRSVSKSEPEDNADGSDPPDEQIDEDFPLLEKKVKPPVAEKPPMSKRPPNLIHRSPTVPQDSIMTLLNTSLTPGTNTKEKVSPQDIYMVIRKTKPKKHFDSGNLAESVSLMGPSSPPRSSLRRIPSGIRQVSQGNEDGDENSKLKQWPERIIIHDIGDTEKKKGKIPPPIPKKPSMLYLPLATPSPNPFPNTPDQRLTPSPVITVDRESSCFPVINDSQSPDAGGNNLHVKAENHSMSLGNVSGSSMEAIVEEKNSVSDKTAASIVEDDDEVFMTSRTTEDLFTVIHRSKRKLLGWKEPGDAFGNRQSSLSPVKNTPESPTGDSPTGSGGTLKSSSKNEDFKALLQRKGSKTSLGTRTSAAELLKTTNPLARRVLTEFAPELDNTVCSKPQP